MRTDYPPASFLMTSGTPGPAHEGYAAALASEAVEALEDHLLIAVVVFCHVWSSRRAMEEHNPTRNDHIWCSLTITSPS